MAHTRRRRQTKHRGNAAGVVESRGRTGRKPTAAEKNPEAREKARARAERVDRRDRPPTWKGAFTKAMLFAVLLLFVLLLLGGGSSAIALFPIALVFYVPVSYYTDLWVYRRRQRSKAAAGRGRAR
jgi:hypothetical protein